MNLLDDPAATAASLLTRSGVAGDEDSSDGLEGLGTGSEDDEEDAAPAGGNSLWERLVKLATGVAPGQKVKDDSPTARLKLLLVRIAFLA
jgi:hypothetical protein